MRNRLTGVGPAVAAGIGAVLLSSLVVGPAEGQGSSSGKCRWKVKFASYVVKDAGREKKAETKVSVTVDGNTVEYPNSGYKKAKVGATVRVGKVVKTVTADGDGTTLSVVIGGREKDLLQIFPRLPATSGKVKLDCKSRNFTRSWLLKADKGSNKFAYKVSVAFERQ